MLKTLMAVENTFSELRLDKTQKQDQELTVAQIMNSLLKIQTEIEESGENHYTIQVRPTKSLMTIRWKWEIDLRDWIW